MEPVQKFYCDPMKAESGKTEIKNGEVFQYDKRDSAGNPCDTSVLWKHLILCAMQSMKNL